MGKLIKANFGKGICFRIIFVIIVLLSVVYINWKLFESMSSKLVTTSFYLFISFLIYRKRVHLDKKIRYLWGLIFIITSVIFSKVSIKEGDIIFLSVAILFWAFTYNHFSEIIKIKKISYLNMLVLILAIVTLDATHPLLKPRIDTTGVGPIDSGSIFYGEGYAVRDYTFEITPPILLINSCETIRLGEKIKGASYKQDFYGINVSYYSDGRITFCLSPDSDFKSILALNINSKRDINYRIDSYNLSRFYWISGKEKSIRQHPISISNYENFPIYFDDNLTFYIIKDTEFDTNELMWDELTKDNKISCKLKQFSLVENITAYDGITQIVGFSAPIIDSKIKKESISLTFASILYLNPNAHKNLHILYFPKVC